ncbi:MAG: DUF6062 family protein, partial [Chloroflexota bacterium]
ADLRYLERLFYERVNDYELRLHLRSSQGFCIEHAHMAEEQIQGKALGLAILYEDILRLALDQLNEQHTLAAPIKKCPVCSSREEFTNRVIAELSRLNKHEALEEAFARSQGLCFKHLRQMLTYLKDNNRKSHLLALQSRIMQSLRADLSEFIRKNDYRFMSEESGPEKDSWLRAIKMIR